MTIIYASIFISFLLIYIAKIPVAYAMYKLDNKYDNSYPRDQQARLTGWGKRALSAHLNTIEGFPAFATATILALFSYADTSLIQILCAIYILARIFYLIFYWIDWNKSRSTVWGIGIISVAGLFLSALFA
jgi:uncharacterized MAPEG superfamily protein